MLQKITQTPQENSAQLEEQALISGQQYTLTQKQKETLLTKILRQKLEQARLKSPQLEKFYQAWQFNPLQMQSISQIPPVPVSMFKLHDLKLCEEKNLARVVKSSGTSGTQSKIFIDQETSARQQKALASILKSFIGTNRKPYLAIDAQNTNANTPEITARTAAIRGLLPYATETCFAMDLQDGKLSLNLQRVREFFKKNQDADEILIFGFTFIVWSTFLQQIPENEKFHFKKAFFLHSGGWKKLSDLNIDPKAFDEKIASVFPCKQLSIIDYYGMAELPGLIFPTCAHGFKHTPNFADIIIRNPSTFQENPEEKKGLIEIISILPTSYPGNAILTEDMGTLKGTDNCPCKRKGKYFTFNHRAKRAPLRGCGDTFI